MIEKDEIYAHPRSEVSAFAFDAEVADVFEDMIQRSVPGYRTTVAMVGILAEKFVREHTFCYDLGCSLGASTLAILDKTRGRDFTMVAVDNSAEMLEKCRAGLSAVQSEAVVDLRCEDVCDVPMQNASMVIMNFTLQFIPQEKRRGLIESIYRGLNAGGVFVLSEKIAFEHSKMQDLSTELHHRFKKLHGYSDLEISQKRTALENVLIPETLKDHQKRLKEAGFKFCEVWFQCFNFCSLIAIK
ncbi:MAG: carboxy-S-adenosyl-L-methionine synthase CmoA [Verrucomicrobiota bacterium]